MNPEPTPTPVSARVFSLDVVRGAALLGILIMNMPAFSASFFAGASGIQRWNGPWDRLVETVRDVLCSGKFNSMFSMLFAVGFTLQLQRLEQRDPEHAVAIYCRRLFWLLIFGLIHGCVFWTGDVLHVYALLGLLLLALRHCPDRLILALIVVTLLYSPALELFQMYTTTLEEVYAANAFYQIWEASNDAAYGQGSFLQAAHEHTREMISAYAAPENRQFNVIFYVQLLTTMLIGLLVGRQRLFQRAQVLLPQLKRVEEASLVIGLVTGGVFGLLKLVLRPTALPTPSDVLIELCYVICRVSLMIFYVSVLVKLCYQERWQGVLQRIALVGRMPLTNYLGQTLICTFLFYGWGLGWWNQVSPLGNVALAFAIFLGVQMPLSAWWLRRHALGPMEYLWRWLTYGRRAMQPDRVEPVGS